MKRRLLVMMDHFIRVAVGTWKQMRTSDVQILAGSLAFTTVISLVPLLAVSLSVFKAFGGFANLLKALEPFILQNFVEASGAQVSKFIQTSIERIHSGALGVVGAIGLLIASTKLFFDMETAVARVWREKPTRSFLFRLASCWSVMFLGPLVLAITLGIIGSKDLGLIGLLPKGSIAFGFTLVAFFSIYKFVPAHQVRFKAAFLSALAASVGVVLAQTFYAQITKHILRYSKIYGSLASVPIFLLWILVLWWVCLGGVALCATIETYRDIKAE